MKKWLLLTSVANAAQHKNTHRGVGDYREYSGLRAHLLALCYCDWGFSGLVLAHPSSYLSCRCYVVLLKF